MTILVYLLVHKYQLAVCDYPQCVTENRAVQARLTLVGVKWTFSSMHTANWHPSTWLSHLPDVELLGLQSDASCIVNMSFRTGNAVLVLLINLAEHKWPAAIVAGLFALHPLHVESMAWLAERKEVLSAFLVC